MPANRNFVAGIVTLSLLEAYCANLIQKFENVQLLPPAYVVRREGNVLTRVCPSICLSTGGIPISHNALQHFPECHGAATGGVPISHNALQHFPECHGAATGGGGTLPGSARGGTLPGSARGGTLPGSAGGVPSQGGVPSRGSLWGYPARFSQGVPSWGVPSSQGGTQPGGYPVRTT